MPSEGFDPSNAAVARGRRDPELAHALEVENLEDAGQDGEIDVVGLLPGDGIIAKVTLAGQTPIGDAWYTYGVQSRVADGEDEEDAFMRVMDVVNTRVMQLGQDSIDRLEAVAEEKANQPRGHIRPRN